MDEMLKLTHVDEQGRARMVDVSGKDVTRHVAMARATVTMQTATLDKIRQNELAKGDALAFMLQYPMLTISVDDIQRDFAGYLHRVQAGETLLLTLSEQPIAEIKPVAALSPSVQGPRPFGLCAGEFLVPDDFDAPLPEDILRQFEGHSDVES